MNQDLIGKRFQRGSRGRKDQVMSTETRIFVEACLQDSHPDGGGRSKGHGQPDGCHPRLVRP